MQTAQRIIKRYRRRRAIVSVSVAIVALIFTLAFRFISERNLNHQRITAFTQHAVNTFDQLLLPLAAGSHTLIPLVGQPCASVHLQLRKQAASLQTVRAVALIQDGILYCSSIFGYRDVPIKHVQPFLPTREPLLMLSTDQTLLKGRPVLIMWYPTSEDGQDGVIEAVNIDLLSDLVLEPQAPLITHAVLSVSGKHLVHGKGIMTTLPPLGDERAYQRVSTHFPFSISVSGPGAAKLALLHLPSQLPLALMMSLLTGFIAWFATASRMSFSREINLGIAGREFELFCQPLLKARTLECDGVEILLRWHNPRQGWISPEVFISIAEEHNLIAPLTRYVLIEIQQQLHFFPDDVHFHIGINAAPSHLRNGELLRDLNQLWFNHHPMQQLIIELTERDVLFEMDSRMVQDLRRRGVKIAIDDFGTGNSSLAWLEQLHPDVLKIDKSFTKTIGTDAINSTVTDMIIALGQRLNIELVAEGVETPLQAQHLRQQGVNTLQGFLYAEPMPIKAFPAWLAGHRETPSTRQNGHALPFTPG